MIATLIWIFLALAAVIGGGVIGGWIGDKLEGK